MTTVTDARGNVKTFDTPDGNYRTITNGGHNTQYNFNEDGLLTTIQFPEGNKINYTYDTSNQNRRSQANLLSVSSEGNDGSIVYNYLYETYFNHVKQIIDAKGNQTNIIHDDHGNIIALTPPDTPPYKFEYHSTSEPKIYGLLHTITDPEGSVSEYIYYPESVPSGDGVQTVSGRITNDSTGGYLKEIIIDKDNDHLSQKFTYDKVGNITSRIDGEGVTTLYGYDNPFGEVSSITEGVTPAIDGQPGLNLESTFKYDANGNVSEKIIRGIKTTYSYDRLNRLVTALYQGVLTGDNVQQIFTYHHDNNSNLKEIIYPRGNKDVFTYDDRDLLVHKSLGNGLTKESYSYTANGNIQGYTDGENNIYSYVHDSHGRMKEMIDPLGNKVVNNYDYNSNILTVDGIGIDGKSFKQSFDYDSLNRITHHKIQKETGFITTQYGYNPSGSLDSVITPNGHGWSITRSGSGLPKIITDPIGNKDDHSYDHRGWLKGVIETETGGRQLSHSFTNNVIGNQVFNGDSINRNYDYVFDHDKQVIKHVRDPQGGLLSYEFDGLNRLKTQTRHINYEGTVTDAGTTCKYDANGNLEQIIDADGNITRYAYDDKDRLTDIFYQDTGDQSVHFTYNCNDQIVTFTDLNGTIVQNTYDNAGRLTDQNIIAGPGVEGSGYRHFEYDGLNRLILASNNDSEVIFVYDQAGRIQREIQKIKENTEGIETVVATYEVMYQHDDNNNKVQVTYPSGKVVTITPDALDRIINIKDASGDPNTFLASYTYEGKGKILEKILQNGITMNAIFDDGRRPEIISYKYKDSDYTLVERGMSWNLTDLKNFDYEAGKNETFKYDSGFRLRNVNNQKNNSSYEYKIDGVENVDQITETKDGTVKIIETLYNSRHQLVKYNGMDLSYDNNGNLTQYKHNYSYNWNNQLAKVTTGTGVNIEYKYDALGRRIVKKVKDPDSETETRYVYDGYQVIEERDKNDLVQYRYTYGNGIDERIRMEQRVLNDDASEEWKSYYLLHDSIGNVIGLTNSRGHLIERYEYTPYGEVTYYNSENAPEVDNIIIENGRIKIRFNRPVDLDNIYINLMIKVTQTSIPGSKEIFNFDRDIEFSPEQIPQDETLTIKIDTIYELSGSSTQPIELLSKDFVYQGEPSMLVHDQGPPRVERIQYDKSSNSLNIEFNEDIDSSSITDSVDIEYDGNTIGGSIEISGDNKIRFVPSENLSPNGEYIIMVKDIKDTAAKTIEVFSYNFQLNQEESLIFSLSILAKTNHSVVGNNSLMHGRTYEPEVGLYYYRNRYYHPELGRFLQQDPMGYEDSMNLYQAFGMNPVNFVDPFGMIANPKYDPLAVQSAYMQFRHHYGSHSAAMKRMYHYKYAIRSGVNDTMSLADTLYENALAQSYYYDALDTTPVQFAKDALAGTINVGFEMMSWSFKIMSMGEPKACEKIDKIKTSVQSGVIKILGARKNSTGYMAGTFYGPAVAGEVSAGLSSKAGKVVDIADFPEDTLSVSKSGSKVPWEYGELDDALGATDKFGNITINKGVTGKELVDTLRHESVHRFFSPKSGLFKELRANIGMSAYNRSHLVRFLEEGIAETYATGNFITGFTFPLYGYGIKKIRLVAETVIYVGLIVSSIYSGKLLLNGR